MAEALHDEVQSAQPLEVFLGPVGLGGGHRGQAAHFFRQGGCLGIHQPVGHGVPVAFGAVGQAGQPVAHQVGEPQRKLVEAGLQIGQLSFQGVAAAERPLAADGVASGSGGQGAWGGLGGKRRAVFLPEQQQGQRVAARCFAAVAGAGEGVGGQVDGRFGRFCAAVGEGAPEKTAVVVQRDPAFWLGRAAPGAESKLIRCQTQYLFSGPIHSLQNPEGEDKLHPVPICPVYASSALTLQRPCV